MSLMLSIVLTGVSLCLFLWVLFRPLTVRSLVSGGYGNHPLLRLMWPWVAAVRPLCEPFVSWRMRARLGRQLRRAAMGPGWTPADVVALQAILLGAGILVVAVSGRLLVNWSWGQLLSSGLAVGVVCALAPRQHIVNRAVQRQRQILRELPFLLDMTTLCVEAGLNLQGALQRAAYYGPEGPLQHEVLHTLAEIRAGTPRMDALTNLAERIGLTELTSLVAALKQADQTGSSLGPILRSQSDQRRSDQFLRAEEQALKAPVKMLFPLVMCIFPCTFLVIGFPVAITVFDGLW